MPVVGRWSKPAYWKKLYDKAPYLRHLTVAFPLLAILAVLAALLVLVVVYRLVQRWF